MMRKLMYPAGKDSISCPGKGGNQGGTYMMEAARRMLMAQGHDGEPSRILMVRAQQRHFCHHPSCLDAAGARAGLPPPCATCP